MARGRRDPAGAYTDPTTWGRGGAIIGRVLTRPGGEPISITHLTPGDRVLAYIEESGRHFGVKIEETITEK